MLFLTGLRRCFSEMLEMNHFLSSQHTLEPVLILGIDRKCSHPLDDYKIATDNDSMQSYYCYECRHFIYEVNPRGPKIHRVTDEITCQGKIAMVILGVIFAVEVVGTIVVAVITTIDMEGSIFL